jgi:hypothetical protein
LLPFSLTTPTSQRHSNELTTNPLRKPNVNKNMNVLTEEVECIKMAQRQKKQIRILAKEQIKEK